MSLDGVYVPTERAPDPGAPGTSGTAVADPPRPVDPGGPHGPVPPDEGGGGGGRPTVFLPTQRMHAGDTDFEVELRPLVDGRIALLTYTSLESLVQCCGEAQPWVSVPVDQIPEVLVLTGAEAVVEDAVLDDDQRHHPDETSGEKGAAP